LINFSDLEYACIEHWLNTYREEQSRVELEQNLKGEPRPRIISLQKISSSEGPTLLNKRAELFIKGGAFALTYK